MTDSPDYIATYSFYCTVTYRIFHVTVPGPYFAAVRKATELVAKQMHEIAKREEPDNEVTIDACRARCYGLHSGVEPGAVHVIDILRGRPRSQVKS